MESTLFFEEIIEMAKKVELNMSVTGVNLQNNRLILLVKTDSVRANNIKQAKRITLEVTYDTKLNSLQIIVAPFTDNCLENVNKLYENSGIIVSVNLKEPKFVEAIKHTLEGNECIELYVVSEDLRTISIKPLFDNEETLFSLRRSFPY